MFNETYTPPVLPCVDLSSNPCQSSLHSNLDNIQRVFEENSGNSELEVIYDVPTDHFKDAWEASFLSLRDFRLIMLVLVIIGMITTTNPNMFYFIFPLLLAIKFIEYVMREINIDISLEIQLK